MMEESDLALCEQKHERLLERLKIVDIRLNDHSKKIDNLEQYKSRSESQIENLCKNIESLISTIKWGFGIMGGAVFSALLGFFIWYVQNN
jgi:chromosome segregation ATPase